jgi:hypothetical protein
MLGKKLVKRCPRGHVMELSWRRCPRCTGRSAPVVAPRDFSDATVLVAPPEESTGETRVVGQQPGGSAAQAAADAPTVLARLVATAGPLTGEQLRVLLGRTKLGKAPRPEPDTALVTLADPYLSKDHATLEAGVGAIILRDLGSTNGTFVNGQKVERAVLADGDEVRLGSTTFRVSRSARS